MTDKKLRRMLDQVPQSTSILGEGLSFSGMITGTGNLVASGEINSDCDIDGPVTIARSGRWVGQIKASHVIVAGQVKGDIRTSGKIEVAASARIEGRLSGSLIAIAEGAVIDGEANVTAQGKVHRFEEKRGRE